MGIPWDGTGINCYVMGQTNMSPGQSCKNTYSTPAKRCTARFLQEATQHQNSWPPPSCKKLSPCTKSFLKCTCQSGLTECSYSGFNFSHYDLPLPTRYCIPQGISCVRAWPRYALHDSFLSIGVDTTLSKKSSCVSLAHGQRLLFLLSRHRKAFLLLLIRSLL